MAKHLREGDLVMRFLLPLLFAGALVGLLLNALHVPVPWLLGPMLVGIGVSYRRGPGELPGWMMIAGQVLLGLSTGTDFPLSTVSKLAAVALPLLGAVVVTGALSLLVGHLLHRWGGVDRATGYMGALPGAASAMVAMSDEMGANAVTVAVLQYLRLLLVVAVTPPLVSYLFPGETSAALALSLDAASASPPWLNYPLLAVCGVVGALGGRLLRIPSPTFLGPFLAALVASWLLPVTLDVPAWLFAAGMVLVGLSIGVRFDMGKARQLGRVALLEVGLVLGLIVAGLGVGLLFHRLTGLSVLTAVLGSTPGGMEVMVASAMELGGDPAVVLAMQMARWLLVLLAGPLVAARLVGAMAKKAS